MKLQFEAKAGSRGVRVTLAGRLQHLLTFDCIGSTFACRTRLGQAVEDRLELHNRALINERGSARYAKIHYKVPHVFNCICHLKIKIRSPVVVNEASGRLIGE